MPPVTCVRPEDIRELNQHQLTRLLKTLLSCEARRFGIPLSGAEVRTQITVPDGGEDGHIRWEGGPEKTDWFPRRFTVFQLKAKKMGPAACGAEVLGREGTLKPRVAEALAQEGAYVQVFNKNCAQDRAKNVRAVRKAVRKARGVCGASAEVDVYDLEKLTDWTNGHIPAVIQVLEERGLTVPAGAKTWWTFAKSPHLQGLYFANAKVAEYQELLRDAAERKGTVTRVVGLSGLGKTRLVLEAFRPSQAPADVRRNALSEQLLYLDSSYHRDQIRDFIITLCNSQRVALVVVDNCDRQLHDALSSEACRSDSQLSLVTMDSEPQGSLGMSGVNAITLSPAMFGDVVKELVTHSYPGLCEADVNRICEFAAGFPKIGALLADQRVRGVPDLGRLEDRELLRKLLWGSAAVSMTELKVLRACSIFTHLGFGGTPGQQRAVVCEQICLMDGNKGQRRFYEICEKFIERGIIEKPGDFIRVTPPPLAIHLAAEFWGCLPQEQVGQVLSAIVAAGLTEPFCEQMARLHFLPRARQLSAALCGERGPFGAAEGMLTPLGARFASSLAEVNPDATARALDRVLGAKNSNELLTVEGDTRRHLVWALEKLCFWAETFPTAARLMLALGAAENEQWGNNATNQFIQLFHVFLPGTQATLAERLPLLDCALGSEDPRRRALGVRALGGALHGSFFSRSGGVEAQGSRAVQQDYRPPTWNEVFQYWDICLDKLVTLVTLGDPVADLALQEAGSKIHDLVRYRRIESLAAAVRRISGAGREWPQALEALRVTLSRESQAMTDREREVLNECVQRLTPQGLDGRLRSFVSLAPWENEKNAEGHYVHGGMGRVTALADELTREPDKLIPLLPALLTGEQRLTSVFGGILAEKVTEKPQLLTAILDALRTVPPSQGNPALLVGFLSGLPDRALVERTLETVCADDALVPYAVEVTRWAKPTREDLVRVLGLAQSGKLDVGRLRFLAYNSVLEHLEAEVAIDLCEGIRQLSNRGASCALHILSMYCYRNRARWEASKTQFRTIVMTPAILLCGDFLHDTVYDWRQATEQLLVPGCTDPELASACADEVVRCCADKEIGLGAGHELRPIARFLLEREPQAVWPVLAAALLSENWYLSVNMRDVLGTEMGDSKHDAVLAALDAQTVMGWCRENMPKGPTAIAHCVPLYAGEGGTEWHPLARRLLDEFGGAKDVRAAISANMHTFSSWGSLVPYFERQATLMRQLTSHPIAAVAEWAKAVLQYLDANIEREKKADEERAAGIWRRDS